MHTLEYTMTIHKAIAVEAVLRELSERFSVMYYPVYKNRRGVDYPAQVMVSYHGEMKDEVVWDSQQMILQHPSYRDPRKGPLTVPKSLLNAAMKAIEAVSQKYSEERYRVQARDELDPVPVAVNAKTIPGLLEHAAAQQAAFAARRNSVALEEVVSVDKLRKYCAARFYPEDECYPDLVLPVLELSLRPECVDERRVMVPGYEDVMAQAVQPMNAEWQGPIPLLPGEPMLTLTNELGIEAVLSYSAMRGCNVLRLGTAADVLKAFDEPKGEVEHDFKALGDGSLI